MKIAPSTIQPFNHEHTKSAGRHARAAANTEAGPGTLAAANAAEQAGDLAKPVKAVDLGGHKATPPGLERALAHLQPERNAGQANAMDRISRNIARYVETQALGTPPAASPTPPAPAETALGTAASTGVTEPSSPPVVDVATAPDAAPAAELAANAAPVAESTTA